jgi:hypothetical protein
MQSVPRSFVSRIGVHGAYKVAAWRYTEDIAWHVKAGRKGNDQRSRAYVVRDGEFDPNTAIPTEKVAILSLIAEWEAVLDSSDLSDPD